LGLGLEDLTNDGLPLADGEELELFDGELLGSAAGLRLGLEDEANDGLPLADGKTLRFIDGELLGPADGSRLRLRDGRNDGSPLVEGAALGSVDGRSERKAEGKTVGDGGLTITSVFDTLFKVLLYVPFFPLIVLISKRALFLPPLILVFI